GFVSFNNPNDYFGPKTERGVKGFQEYYGLTVSGIADDETLEKMDEILSSPFQSGKRHEDSIKLKEDLNKLSYLDFKNPTTYYGPITKADVHEFQKKYGLPESGIAEPKTKAEIEKQAKNALVKGMQKDKVQTLKQNLNKLGFTSFNNPNNYFGSKTEQGVKDL